MQQVQPALPIGSIVGERYQIEKLLGKGGFGAVYLVRDLRVGQNVFALKEISDPNQRERRHFTMEAELLRRLDHPSLPRVYRVFDEPSQGRAYMLMDYIEGTNLEKLRRQQPGQRLSLNEALTLIGPIIEAVAYLHAQQPPIIHRDIKPSNIIAPTSGERTMLVDFGIAKEFHQDATTTAIRHASPGYGAPEQYSSGTDQRTDIYGLGATLYTLLTGTVPTDAFFRMTQQMGKGQDPLLPVRQLAPNIPEYVSAAIARAMALESDERFATVEEFWQALQLDTFPTPAPVAVGDGAPIIKTVRPPYLARSNRLAASSRPRGRWLMMLALLLLALAVGFASALFLFAHQRGQQTPPSTVVSKTAVVTHVATATATPSPTPLPQPTATPTTPPQPTATTPPPRLPVLANSYTGTIHDNLGSIDTTMSLNSMSQQQQNIRGNFRVYPPLSGNGPLTGTVNASSAIQFIVYSSDPSARAPLFFTGQIQANGAMGGQYCSLDSTGHCNHAVGGYGTWFVQPVTSGS